MENSAILAFDIVSVLWHSLLIHHIQRQYVTTNIKIWFDTHESVRLLLTNFICISLFIPRYSYLHFGPLLTEIIKISFTDGLSTIVPKKLLLPIL